MSEFSEIWKHKNNQHALAPLRWNVAAQVAGELKTVTNATPPTEERRRRRRSTHNRTGYLQHALTSFAATDKENALLRQSSHVLQVQRAVDGDLGHRELGKGTL